MEIVVEEMSVCYRQGTSLERQALSDLTLKIPAGTFAGVVGATGSGKSTLIRVLGGLLPPTRGRVRIGGEQTHPEHPPPAFTDEPDRCGVPVPRAPAVRRDGGRGYRLRSTQPRPSGRGSDEAGPEGDGVGGPFPGIWPNAPRFT